MSGSPAAAGALDPTTPEGAAHVARLARLELAPAELQAMAAHLGRVLEYVAVLDQLPLDGVPATLHDDALTPEQLRPDVVARSLSQDEALANAPRRGPEGFVVPAVLGGET